MKPKRRWFNALLQQTSTIRSPRRRVTFRARVAGRPDLKALTVDLSRSGMRLACNQPIEQGAILQLYLYLDGSHPLALIGICRWSVIGEDGQGLAGIDLKRSDPGALEQIQQLVGRRQGLGQVG